MQEVLRIYVVLRLSLALMFLRVIAGLMVKCSLSKFPAAVGTHVMEENALQLQEDPAALSVCNAAPLESNVKTQHPIVLIPNVQNVLTTKIVKVKAELAIQIPKAQTLEDVLIVVW